MSGVRETACRLLRAGMRDTRVGKTPPFQAQSLTNRHHKLLITENTHRMIQGRLRTAFARASRIQHTSTRRALVVRTMATLKEEVAVCFPAAKRCLVDSLIDGDVAGATLIEPVVVAPPARGRKDAAAAPAVDALAAHDAATRAWADAARFKAKSGEVLLLPGGAGGGVGRVLLGLASPTDLWGFAALPGKLLPGRYALDPAAAAASGVDADKAALGFALGSYKFERYKTGKADNGGAASTTEPSKKTELVWPTGADRAAVAALAAAYTFARDVITTPAEDMGPQHLAAEAAALAAAHAGASIVVTTGDDLLAANFPAVHTVGRAASRPPALIDISWAPPGVSGGGGELPLLALVGKGVCFDSGGLDIKTAAGMKLMKKDMGGGALMLALAHLVMAASLPVRLRVLVPAVENAIAGNAYRPLDVLATRAGVTVENGNTDAEGRLILCDALAFAAEAAPDVIVDAATLTGAARVALGPDVPAVFANDDAVWAELAVAAELEDEPLWRLPLHPGYRRMLDSKVADLSSTGSEAGQAGAITAALFLNEFVPPATPWLHIDTAGYVSGASTGAGRPEGGEALALRALWAFVRRRYGGGGGGAVAEK